MDTYDVFICYQHKAKKVVDFIVEALERAGISCWYAPRNLDVEGAGKDRQDVISKAISNARCVIAVISDEALESLWVKADICHADDYNIPIIPFEIAPISVQNELTLRLGIRHKIVAYENPSTSIEKLIRTINGILSDEDSGSLDSNKALSNEVGTRGQYSIMQNEKGDIMIMMDARVGNPEHPRFIYDGSGMALLYRNPESSVSFKNIDEEAREPLKSVKDVLVVEILNDDVEREYLVPVRIVKDINSLIIQ
jgi:hypothetical protein